MAIRNTLKKKESTSSASSKKGGGSGMQAWIKKLKHWAKMATLFFFGSTIFMVIVYRFIPVPLTPLMVTRFFEQVANGKEIRFSKDWESIDKIENLPLAVVAAEDAHFMNHHGFDFDAMWKAFKTNKSGKKIKGGSTISQQTAKNVFLWQGRTYLRKVLEAYFTLLIEIFWSKERILEVYLNSIEMGDGVYGAEAASQKYFKKPAYQLTRSEAAAIASILPNPRKWNPVKRTAYVEKRRRVIRRNMDILKDLKFED
jgi:monofunctional biosynthetic peptidoglycan transglycosylase